MEGLRETAAAVADILKDIEECRETAVTASRAITRLSKKVIHAIHTGTPYTEDLEALRSKAKELVTSLGFDMDRYQAAVDAFGEFAEAEILRSVIEDDRMPSFMEIDTVPQSWLLGMADAIGELRRSVLNALTSGDMDEGRRLFGRMEEMYEELSLFDVPDAVLPIRRKQDIARGVVERTRSDLFTARMSLPACE